MEDSVKVDISILENLEERGQVSREIKAGRLEYLNMDAFYFDQAARNVELILRKIEDRFKTSEAKHDNPKNTKDSLTLMPTMVSVLKMVQTNDASDSTINDILEKTQLEGHSRKYRPNRVPTMKKMIHAQLDEDFSFKKSICDKRSIHPYPAKFIGEIPRTLMENFLIPHGTAILDPFCGSGTVLVEAQKKHIPSIGIDLNPIACLISEVSTSKIPKLAFETGRSCVERARKNKNPILKNNIPNVDHWFAKDIQIGLSSLKNEILNLENLQIKKILKFVLSSIIVRVSNQESDTRYAAINKKSHLSDVFNYFLSSLRRLEQLNPDRNFDTPVQILQKDTLQTTPSDFKWHIGMVITSPPYPNAYEYWLYHKYRMWWLDFDPLKVKESEIGARAHFFKKNPHNAGNLSGSNGKIVWTAF